MAIKNSMMVDMKWTSALLDVMENASVGSLIRKAKLSLSRNTRCTTTTIKNGYQNQQTSDVCRS